GVRSSGSSAWCSRSSRSSRASCRCWSTTAGGHSRTSSPARSSSMTSRLPHPNWVTAPTGLRRNVSGCSGPRTKELIISRPSDLSGAQFVRTVPERLPPDMYADIERKNWYDFACVLLFLVGTFNIIDGISAISDSKYLTNSVIFGNLHAWGWFFLIWGIVQIIAAFGAYRGASWALVLAIVTAFFKIGR